MTGVLAEICSRIGDKRCLLQKEDKLGKGGCRIEMNGIPPDRRLVINCDKPGAPLSQTEKRCDYLLFYEDHNGIVLVVVLLRRGKFHASQVIEQLQAGAAAAEKLVPPEKAVRFRPVLFSGAKSRHELARLRTKIRFHGHREPIRLKSCGQSLKEVLR